MICGKCGGGELDAYFISIPLAFAPPGHLFAWWHIARIDSASRNGRGLAWCALSRSKNDRSARAASHCGANAFCRVYSTFREFISLELWEKCCRE